VRYSKPDRSMSEAGQKQTSRPEIWMSAIPPKADIRPGGIDVRFGPKADILWFQTISA
jgi:hypothetical protein